MKLKYWLALGVVVVAAIMAFSLLPNPGTQFIKSLLAGREQEIEALKATVTNVEKKIKDKDAQIKSKDVQIKAKDEQIEKLKREKAKKEAEVGRIEEARRKITVPDDVVGIVSEFGKLGYKSCAAITRSK